MKAFKFSTVVVLIARLSAPRTRVSEHGKTRVATHKIEMIMTPEMRRIHDELGKRTNRHGKPLGLGVVNSAGNLVMQLDREAVQKLADTAGVSVAYLPMLAKGASVALKFEHRLPDDKVINNRTQEEIVIEFEHVTNSGLELAIPQARLDAIAVGIAQAEYTASLQTQPIVADIAISAKRDDDEGELFEDEEPITAPVKTKRAPSNARK